MAVVVEGYVDHLRAEPATCEVREVHEPRRTTGQVAPERLHIALLTGGSDRPYALGLASSLVSDDVLLDFIGSDQLESDELRSSARLNFLNLRGDQGTDATFVRKTARVLLYYVRLLRYARIAKPRIFHILWNNKFELFDRTLLMLYYRLLGKKIAFTAHNVNARQRDAQDSALNRLTLKIQYRLADHVFVHTDRMKRELLEQFAVRKETVTVIPFGTNSSVPQTNLTPAKAKERLGIGTDDRTILFFGNIGPYKGLEFLVAAFQRLAATHPGYKLIIAGKLARGCEHYYEEIRRAIRRDVSQARVIERIEYIPDGEAELYFKAADVLVLPYTHVSQSGVLISSYCFGLPVVATDVGSLREDIVEGRTGYLCRPRDPEDMARAIEGYFQSDLCKSLESSRLEIRDYARQCYSWETVSELTRAVYRQLLEDSPRGVSKD